MEYDTEFPMLNEKVRKIQPIIDKYNFEDVIHAVFCINAWRDNRSLFESTSALNLALMNHSHNEGSALKSYSDLQTFFNLIEPVLNSHSDADVTLNDFGEYKLQYKNKWYKVLLGSGYEQNSSMIQFIPEACHTLNKEDDYSKLLTYISDVIDHLEATNISRYSERGIYFDIPSEAFFNQVLNLFKVINLSADDYYIELLSSDNLLDENKCFFIYNKTVIPLFNAAILAHYFSELMSRISENQKADIIDFTLIGMINENFPQWDNEPSFLFPVMAMEGKKRITSEIIPMCIFTDNGAILVINKCRYDDNALKKEINKIKELHLNDSLIISKAIPETGNQYMAIKINKNNNLIIVTLSGVVDITSSHFEFRAKDDAAISFTPLDFAFFLNHIPDFSELIDFITRDDSGIEKILLMGTSANLFIIWRQSFGEIAQGAISYSLLHIPYGIVDDYVYDYFCNELKDFPFHLSESLLSNPYMWMTKVNKPFNEFATKSRPGIIGFGIKTNNNNYILHCHSIAVHKKEITNELRQELHLIDDFNNRLFARYGDLISEMFDSKLLYFLYLPIDYAKGIDNTGFTHQEKKYVYSDILEQDNTLNIRYTCDISNITTAIQGTITKEVEIEYLLELISVFEPFNPKTFSKIVTIIEKDKDQKKEVDIFEFEMPCYYSNTVKYFKISDAAFVAAKKEIAQICQKENLSPGTYKKKDATHIVSQIEISLVKYIENKISTYSQKELTIKILSDIASTQFDAMINKERYKGMNDIDENVLSEVKTKSFDLREKSRRNTLTLMYFLESNLFVHHSDNQPISDEEYNKICAYIDWLIVLEDNSGVCKFLNEDVAIRFDSEFIPDTIIDDALKEKFEGIKKRSYDYSDYLISNKELDNQFLSKTFISFEKDTEVKFQVFIELLAFLSFVEDKSIFEEVESDVFSCDKIALLSTFLKNLNAVYNNEFCENDAEKAIDYLTLKNTDLKKLHNNDHSVIPTWDRLNRKNRAEMCPLIVLNNSETIIFSPIHCYEVRSRWTNGILSFYLPYESGLTYTKEILRDWKKEYEDIMVNDLANELKNLKIGDCYVEEKLNKLDSNGHSHPNDLGDYDILVFDVKEKIIWNLECKFVHKVGSIYETAMQQKDFFDESESNKKNRYAYKFKKRIDYLEDKNNYSRIIKALGYPSGDYTVLSFMVTNKILSPIGYEVSFPIYNYHEMIDHIKSYYNNLGS